MLPKQWKSSWKKHRTSTYLSKVPKKAPDFFKKIVQNFSVFVKITQKSSQKAPKFWRDFNLATSLQCTVNSIQLPMCRVHWTEYALQCTLVTVHCTPSCKLYTGNWTVYTKHCKLYTVECILYSLRLTLNSVKGTVYTVQCTQCMWAHPCLSTMGRGQPICRIHPSSCSCSSQAPVQD